MRARWRRFPVSQLVTALLVLAVAGVIPAAAQEATVVPYTPTVDLGKLRGKVRADGSSTVGPITEAVAEEFGREAKKVESTVDISGTGGGFKRFCSGGDDGTDLQNASRAIEPEEAQNCLANGVSYYEFAVAFDGIALAVNPENDWVSCLTVDQLKRLWEPNSTIDNWNELDPSFPDRGINLYGPGTDSGTYDYFTSAIVGEEGASRTDYTPSEDDNQLVEGVAGDKGALGFFGLAYYEQNADRLKLVAVDGGRGCVSPSVETVRSQEYTPLSRPLYVYVSANSLTRPEVQEFMRFYLANAYWLAPDVGYVDSPVTVYLRDQAKLEAAIAGTGVPDGPATPAS